MYENFKSHFCYHTGGRNSYNYSDPKNVPYQIFLLTTGLSTPGSSRAAANNRWHKGTRTSSLLSFIKDACMSFIVGISLDGSVKNKLTTVSRFDTTVVCLFYSLAAFLKVSSRSSGLKSLVNGLEQLWMSSLSLSSPLLLIPVYW